MMLRGCYWCEEATGTSPSWVGLLKAGLDCRSTYLHFRKSVGDLQWMAEQLSGWYLTHKATECSLALNLRPTQRPKVSEATGLKLLVLQRCSTMGPVVVGGGHGGPPTMGL